MISTTQKRRRGDLSADSDESEYVSRAKIRSVDHFRRAAASAEQENESSSEENLNLSTTSQEIVRNRNVEASRVFHRRFEQHLQWNRDHGTPIEFDDNWSREDEMSLFRGWSEQDDQISKGFAAKEVPLWAICLKMYEKSPMELIPSELEISTAKNEARFGLENNPNMSQNLCTLMQTCISLPSIEGNVSVFRYGLRLVRVKRLAHGTRRAPHLPKRADIKIDKLRDCDVAKLRDSLEGYLKKKAETWDKARGDSRSRGALDFVDRYYDRALDYAMRSAQPGLNEFLNELEALDDFKHKGKDEGITAADFEAIIAAWNIYAKKNELPNAESYRRKVGPAKDFFDNEARIARENGETLYPTTKTLPEFKKQYELKKRRDKEKSEKTSETPPHSQRIVEQQQDVVMSGQTPDTLQGGDRSVISGRVSDTPTRRRVSERMRLLNEDYEYADELMEAGVSDAPARRQPSTNMPSRKDQESHEMMSARVSGAPTRQVFKNIRPRREEQCDDELKGAGRTDAPISQRRSTNIPLRNDQENNEVMGTERPGVEEQSNNPAQRHENQNDKVNRRPEPNLGLSLESRIRVERCYNCGKEGHYARYCEEICGRCGQSGHKLPDCEEYCICASKPGHKASDCKTPCNGRLCGEPNEHCCLDCEFCCICGSLEHTGRQCRRERCPCQYGFWHMGQDCPAKHCARETCKMRYGCPTHCQTCGGIEPRHSVCRRKQVRDGWICESPDCEIILGFGEDCPHCTGRARMNERLSRERKKEGKTSIDRLFD